MKDFKYIKDFEKIINENKYSMTQLFILHCMHCHDNYGKLSIEEKAHILRLIYIFYMKAESDFDIGLISDIVMGNYKDISSRNDIYKYL